MFAKLKGFVEDLQDDHFTLDVQGVGYLIHASGRSLGALANGQAATLFIETMVREDAIKLFGFTTALERDWFRLLMTVQGVGAKVALSVLSTLKPSELASAIALADKSVVARTPGVGPKVAQRIVSELKDKSPHLSVIDGGLSQNLAQTAETLTHTVAQDAVSALTNLGYGQSQAAVAVATVLKEETDQPRTETLIRKALKELAK